MNIKHYTYVEIWNKVNGSLHARYDVTGMLENRINEFIESRFRFLDYSRFSIITKSYHDKQPII